MRLDPSKLGSFGFCVAFATAVFGCSDGQIGQPAPANGTTGGDGGGSSGAGSAGSGNVTSGAGGGGPLVSEDSPDFDFFAALEAETVLPASDMDVACATNHDPVATALCNAPSITSIADLQKALGLAFLPGQTVSAHSGNPGYAVVTHSTSLSTRYVTPVNPRAVFFKSPFESTVAQGVAMGYARGEGHAELAGYDAQAKRFNYYLIRFDKTFATTFDRTGPKADQGFTGYTVYSEKALADTQLDCVNCHRGGTLLMQGLSAPWMHWAGITDLSDPMFKPPALALVSAYSAVHTAPETYAGISKVDDNRPQYLESFLKMYYADTTQPGSYPGKTIETEFLSGGTSPTWDSLFAQVVAAQALPIPSFAIDPTDPAAIAAYTKAYADVSTGALPPDQLPSPQTLFDKAELQNFSIEPPSGATPLEILTSMCGSCHSAKFTDPTRSRYKFRVDELDQIDSIEKLEAVSRLQRPPGTPGHMPPTRFRRLSLDQIESVSAFLSQ